MWWFDLRQRLRIDFAFVQTKIKAKMATVTLQNIEKGRIVLEKSGEVFRTPLVRLPSELLGVPPGVTLYGKMENMQNTGSFKVRGLVNLLQNAPKELHDGKLKAITMSGGNFARAFSQILSQKGIRGKVVMPETVPKSRVERVKSYGMEVELCDVSRLKSTIEAHLAQGGMIYLHPFEDLDLIAGHGSIGLEILEDCPDVDVVVVCCGGGGLLAGVSTAVKQKQEAMASLPGSTGHKTLVVGVEPEGAPTMYLSLQKGHAVSKGDVRSVAAGLCPPFAGENTFQHVKKYVDDVVLVSDAEIIEATRALYDVGVLVEPSGAAALAAVRAGKIADLGGKKVVVTLSGSNITPSEISNLLTK